MHNLLWYLWLSYCLIVKFVSFASYGCVSDWVELNGSSQLTDNFCVSFCCCEVLSFTYLYLCFPCFRYMTCVRCHLGHSWRQRRRCTLALVLDLRMSLAPCLKFVLQPFLDFHNLSLLALFCWIALMLYFNFIYVINYYWHYWMVSFVLMCC